MAADYTELDAAIASLGLEYSVVFVPQNESRNKSNEEPSLNWEITLKRGGKLVAKTDYMQGIGHVPGYPMGLEGRNRSLDEDKLLRLFQHAAVDGRYPAHMGPNAVKRYRVMATMPMKQLPKPELRDVLYSLVSDSDVLESSGFEDWASNLGYDTDSRKAEAIYNSCIEIALKLKALIGQANLDKLRELYQGY